MKELEDKYGFKLCMQYRDFLVEPIVDKIVDKVTKSSCTIVITAFQLSYAQLHLSTLLDANSKLICLLKLILHSFSSHCLLF
jgi:hypothetical protein